MPTKPEKPHRKTPNEMLFDLALANATRTSHVGQPFGKVGVNENSKGEPAFAVDVSHPDVFVALEQMTQAYDILRAKYPRENGATK